MCVGIFNRDMPLDQLEALARQAGAIVFDDYGFSGCEGVTRFVNEMRNDPRFLFFHNLNGRAVLVRR